MSVTPISFSEVVFAWHATNCASDTRYVPHTSAADLGVFEVVPLRCRLDIATMSPPILSPHHDANDYPAHYSASAACFTSTMSVVAPIGLLELGSPTNQCIMLRAAMVDALHARASDCPDWSIHDTQRHAAALKCIYVLHLTTIIMPSGW